MTVFKKNLLTLGLAAFGFGTITAVSILLFMNSLYYETNTAALKKTAKTLLTVIGEEYIAGIFSANAETGTVVSDIELPENARSVRSIEDYRLTLILPSGYVVWDSHVTDRIVNHIDREEVISALNGREASARRDSISTNMKQIYYALPVIDNRNNVAGVFRLSVSVPDFKTRISPVVFPLLVFALAMIITVFWAIFAFSRSLSSSLGRLVSITQAGASLLSGPEAEEPVAPEFRSLEKAIRAMTSELNFRLEQARAEGIRLEAILNGMSEAMLAMDGALKLHLVNPRARELFNLGSREINAEKRTITLLEATRSAELEEAAKRALSTGDALETELTFRSGNASFGSGEQHFQVFISPLLRAFSETGNGVVIVLQDITRIVQLERIRKDFVANVSHELRTPIQLIKGFSETLLEEPNGSSKEKIIHFLEIINKNAVTMENLTNDLLVLADLENSTANSGEMEELFIAPLINDAVSSVEPKAKSKNVEIIVNCPGGLCANLDGSLIIQALINLIDNGIKYSPPGSKIWVNARTEETNGTKELLFEVRDKGIGIPAEHLDRIFERFYRVDRARAHTYGREAGGTGLGLSIVRHIALFHNGKAEAESRMGEGSIFRIRIPVQVRIHH